MVKILIVEDDELLSKLYLETLKSSGYDVSLVGNGKDGLELILEGGYDLILLDVMMPEMDGLTVLKNLQLQSPKQKNGPIIIISNLTGGAIEKEAMSLGAKECFDKTKFKGEALLEKIKTILNNIYD